MQEIYQSRAFPSSNDEAKFTWLGPLRLWLDWRVRSTVKHHSLKVLESPLKHLGLTENRCAGACEETVSEPVVSLSVAPTGPFGETILQPLR